MRRAFIGGNWKMNYSFQEALQVARQLKMNLIPPLPADVAIFPPAVYINPLAEILRNSPVAIGGQNVYYEERGAFTGEISCEMLSSSGAKLVIVGHSERRHIFGESDKMINLKLHRALASSLVPVFCVGEKLNEREAGKTFDIVGEQLRNGLSGLNLTEPSEIIIAYEPVWAIGTGVNATPEQAEEVHSFIRNFFAERYTPQFAEGVRIIYGGSLNPSNAREIFAMPNIDGGLVGGASLKAESFISIIRASNPSWASKREE